MNLFFSSSTVDKAASSAVSKAIERHRRLGQSIVVMREGKITWVAPEDISPYSIEGELQERVTEAK